ncbi:MAG: hypothetical protein KME17_22430 [Cyanosarcina radialis HA8281-LM2]|nr:hypothetical protein [Cyanosarcina radialis HA8281-LM2]
MRSKTMQLFLGLTLASTLAGCPSTGGGEGGTSPSPASTPGAASPATTASPTPVEGGEGTPSPAATPSPTGGEGGEGGEG